MRSSMASEARVVSAGCPRASTSFGHDSSVPPSSRRLSPRPAGWASGVFQDGLSQRMTPAQDAQAVTTERRIQLPAEHAIVHGANQVPPGFKRIGMVGPLHTGAVGNEPGMQHDSIVMEIELAVLARLHSPAHYRVHMVGTQGCSMRVDQHGPGLHELACQRRKPPRSRIDCSGPTDVRRSPGRAAPPSGGFPGPSCGLRHALVPWACRGTAGGACWDGRRPCPAGFGTGTQWRHGPIRTLWHSCEVRWGFRTAITRRPSPIGIMP